jgi:hypothetical protein
MEQPIRREPLVAPPAPAPPARLGQTYSSAIGPERGGFAKRNEQSGESPFTREQMDEIVDEVVDRIEQRVIDELERRGRRADPGVF